MNLINELNNEQIRLLKEADIVENKEYTEDECEYIVGQVMGHIMSFSKSEIGDMVCKYRSTIDKIVSFEEDKKII